MKYYLIDINSVKLERQPLCMAIQNNFRDAGNKIKFSWLSLADFLWYVFVYFIFFGVFCLDLTDRRDQIINLERR